MVGWEAVAASRLPDQRSSAAAVEEGMVEKGTAGQVDSSGKDEVGSHIAEEHLAVALCTAGERPRDSSLHTERVYFLSRP